MNYPNISVIHKAKIKISITQRILDHEEKWWVSYYAFIKNYKLKIKLRATSLGA